MKRSLRSQVLVGTSLCSAAVLTLLGFGIYFTMRHHLLSSHESSLITKARALCATAEQHRGEVKLEFEPKQMPEFSATSSPDYFEIWLDDGRVLARSESLAGADLPRTPEAARASAGQLVLPGTRQARAIVLSFVPRIEGDAGAGTSRTCTIAVAGTPVEAERTLSYLRWLLLAACATAIALSGFLLMKVVGRAVSPVTRLAREIEALAATDLGCRLQPAGMPSELAPIVDRLNGLLARLESAFSRERAFTADVAHELRTPLAGLMTTLEVCRSRPREPRSYEDALDECRAMTERMQAMVESLLLLARADAGQLPVVHRSVDVAWLLREAWASLEQRAAARRLCVTWDLGSACEVETDPDKLRIVIQNVLDNAVSHVEEGGGVRISAGIRDDELHIQVANTGSRIAAADVAFVFERFWRGDQGRSETGTHCGLGLSLTQRLVGLINGRIAIDSVANGEFVVRLWLPRGARDPSMGGDAQANRSTPAGVPQGRAAHRTPA